MNTSPVSKVKCCFKEDSFPQSCGSGLKLGSDKNLSLIDKTLLWIEKPYRVGASLSQEVLCSSVGLPGIYPTGGGACLI